MKETKTLAPGTDVRIVTGSYKGFTGMVVEPLEGMDPNHIFTWVRLDSNSRIIWGPASLVEKIVDNG